MKTFIHRFPAPAVAVVAVIFSATIVFASQPAGRDFLGLTTAANHADESAEPSESPDASEPPDASEAPESPDASDAANHCNVDLTQDPSVLAGLNHGSVVCTAAQQPTPSGYPNHGAWVSHWAKMNHGKGHGHGGGGQ